MEQISDSIVTCFLLPCTKMNKADEVSLYIVVARTPQGSVLRKLKELEIVTAPFQLPVSFD